MKDRIIPTFTAYGRDWIELYRPKHWDELSIECLLNAIEYEENRRVLSYAGDAYCGLRLEASELNHIKNDFGAVLMYSEIMDSRTDWLNLYRRANQQLDKLNAQQGLDDKEYFEEMNQDYNSGRMC